MKGFFIDVYNNLLEPKHRKAMRESVWLFMWLLDKMTSVSEDGIGKVLGGKPVTHKEVNEELEVPERTYRDWVARLRDAKYINTLRTPYGLVITVNKAKKHFKRDKQKEAYLSRSGKAVENPGRDMQKTHPDVQVSPPDVQKPSVVIKTSQDNIQYSSNTPNLNNLRKLRQLKTPLLRKTTMSTPQERSRIQEEIAPAMRK